MGKFIAGCAVGFAGASVLAGIAAKKLFEDETFGSALRSGIVSKATWLVRDLVYGPRPRRWRYRDYVDYSRHMYSQYTPVEDEIPADGPDEEKAHPVFQKFVIFGMDALYSENRGELEDEAKADGYVEGEDYFIYWLRGDDSGEIASIEESCVAVNYAATILTREALSFPEGRNYMDLSFNDWDFLSDEGDVTVGEFLGD